MEVFVIAMVPSRLRMLHGRERSGLWRAKSGSELIDTAQPTHEILSKFRLRTARADGSML